MTVMCASVLGIEAIVVLLATSLATSNGSVENTMLAWVVGLILMVLLIAAAGMVRRPHGLTIGWIMQALVLATAIVVGWSMLIVGVVFVVLWWLAIHIGRRVEAMHAQDDASS